MDNPTLIQRIITYNAQQRTTPPTEPPPQPLTLEQRVAALESRVTALEGD